MKNSGVETTPHWVMKLLVWGGGEKAKKKLKRKPTRGLTWKVILLNLKKKNDTKMKKLVKNKLKRIS